jgi:hypothetical protein
MRCGSALVASKAPPEVHPPRMSRWQKPLRSVMRQARKSLPLPVRHGRKEGGDIRCPLWVKKASHVAFFGAALSLIPGLAHCIQRRFRVIRWWVAGWFLLLLAALFLYGSNAGMLCLGLALGVHVWIAIHSALLEEYYEFGYRVAGILVALAFYYGAYLEVGRAVFYNLQGGYSIISVPAAQIRRDDFLLGRPSHAAAGNLTRGSFALVRLARIGGGRRDMFGHLPRSAYGQVIGLGGDTVAVKEGRFEVNGHPQDADRFPVPGWLRNMTFLMVVPEGSYFISAEYQGVGYNEQQVPTVCVVPLDRVEAKAFLRWMPLGRRGFIEEYE